MSATPGASGAPGFSRAGLVCGGKPNALGSQSQTTLRALSNWDIQVGWEDGAGDSGRNRGEDATGTGLGAAAVAAPRRDSRLKGRSGRV